MRRILTKARWLSIDIAVGAVVLLFFICDIHQIHVNPFVVIALFIAVWLIYTWDHLLDVRNLSKPSTKRHRFHKNNFREIARISFFVLLCGIINFLFIPIKVAMYGLILSLFSAFYLALQKKFSLIGGKELTVAVGYTFGVFLYPMVRVGFQGVIFYEILSMFILTYVNILIVAKYDTEADRQDQVSSLSLTKGLSWVTGFIYVLLCFGIIISMGGVFIFSSDSYHIFTLLSFIILLIVNYFDSYFSINDRFRLVADGIFFLPLLFMI